MYEFYLYAPQCDFFTLSINKKLSLIYFKITYLKFVIQLPLKIIMTFVHINWPFIHSKFTF